MVVSLRGGSVGTGTMEDESSTGHIWATGFHRVMAHSHLAHSLKIMNSFSNFSKNFFSGRGKLWITETSDMGVRLYIHSFIHSFTQSPTQVFSKRILTAKLAADCAEWSRITKNTSLCFSIVAKIFAERSFPVWGVLDFLLFLRWFAFDLFDFLAFFWPFFLPSGPASLSSWSEKIWGKKTHTHWKSDLTSWQEISDFISDGKNVTRICWT